MIFGRFLFSVDSAISGFRFTLNHPFSFSSSVQTLFRHYRGRTGLDFFLEGGGARQPSR